MVCAHMVRRDLSPAARAQSTTKEALLKNRQYAPALPRTSQPICYTLC